MKVSDLASTYGFNVKELETYVLSSGFKTKSSLLSGVSFEDTDAAAIISGFQIWRAENERREAIERAEMEAQAERDRIEQAEKQKVLSQILITSGFNFDGYTIKKYSGYISGDDVVQISRGSDGIFSSAANVGDALSASLVRIRRNALNELKEAAYDLGCNAVIGVDFDYITLEPETANYNGGTTYLPYVFCVTANGNAVIIEKDEA